MAISNKKKKLIVRRYPELSVDELAAQLNLKRRDVVRVLEEAGVSVTETREKAREAPILDFARVNWIAMAIIAVTTIIVYSNSLQNNFHYDDFHSLTRNINIQYLRNIPRFFTHPEYFSSKPNVAMPRPILLSTFAINYALTEYNAWSWILINLLLHVGNALIFYVAICHLSGRGRVALLAGLIFALHPVNSESVNYVNCRSETLGALFLILTIYFFCRNLREERVGLYIASLIFYTIGLLTKETVFVAPALLLVIDALFIFRREADSISKRFFNKYLGLIIISGAYLVYRNLVLSFTFIEKANRPVFDNLLTQTRSFVHYFNLLFYPIHLNTSYENIDYTRLIQDGVVWNILFILALLSVGLVLWRKIPLVTLAVMNFFITLAPTTSVIPLNAYMNEHRVYLPSMGFALLAGAAIVKLRSINPFKMKFSPGLVNLVVILILTAFSALVVWRNFVWKTDMILWRDAIQKSPHKAQVISDLGNAYYRSEDPDVKRSAQLYKWSIRMDETYFKAFHNLGTVNFTWARKARDPEEATRLYKEAEKYFRLALNIMPINAETWNDLGSTYIQLKKLDDAEKCYRQAVSLDRKNYKAMMNLGIIMEMQDRLEEAVEIYKQSIAIYDRDATAHYFLARLLANQLQRYEEALKYFERAYKLEPGNLKYKKAYQNLHKFLKAHQTSSP